MTNSWQFIDKQGTFRLENPHHTSYLYFPLLNESGMVSSITPMLNGDAKVDQNTYLLLPTSVEDLHNTRSARNFWVRINEEIAWSVTGNSENQIAKRFSNSDEQVTLTAGFLWHKITRHNEEVGIKAEITNFVPVDGNHVELMRVAITNTNKQAVTLTPTAAIPIYGRSADNIRDHRHVTSLLNQITCHPNGVVVQPTLSFDERGHLNNETSYFVLGAEADGTRPVGFFPDVENFIGEGGTLDWPQAVVSDQVEPTLSGTDLTGFEAMGGLRFKDLVLAPGDTQSYIIVLGILGPEEDLDSLFKRYGSGKLFAKELEKSKELWQNMLSTLSFESNDERFDGWLKWVTLQPILRRRIGNSFLPYHDYGRGGRGWRDLWQDILALLIIDERKVGELLLSHFAGVRMDGSNATIIGTKPGEFKADRNDIPRVWMDHGSWPLLTTKFYINQRGNLDFLLREQVYFKDHLSHRSHKIDVDWTPDQGTKMKTATGEVYSGSVLEHMLIQHLTVFFNVGEHNNILLEDADWNDALDMANERGESVAFTAFYSGNLRSLGELCQALSKHGVESISLANEVLRLLDSLSSSVDYDSVAEKKQRLDEYFSLIAHTVSGNKSEVELEDLAKDLFAKADWLAKHIRQHEWIAADEDCGWFNSYYDNNSQPVEGADGEDVRMMLTGQVFTIMGNVASDEQVNKIFRAADKYLFDESVGGYRLNTDFGDTVSDLGRVFGFAYGHKENGAMFSHMATMFAYALYSRGLVKEGWKVLKNIYQQSQDFPKSRIYPGIPEYFNPRGRGMYPYLTGSASWYLLTMLTEIYGIKGKLGDLVIEPKLTVEQFGEDGTTSVQTVFAGKHLKITYQNPQLIPYGQYSIKQISMNDDVLIENVTNSKVIISKELLMNYPDQIDIDVSLGEN